jgi:AcrR family transcriptional regulator
MTSPIGADLAAPTAEKSVLRKLKPGPGLSREEVATDQTLRLRLALSSLAAESGYDAVTVRSLIRRAGISTSTFYNHYASVEHCFVGIVGTTIRSVVMDIEHRRELGVDPLGALRTALWFWMGRLRQEPQIARAVFVESFAAGPQVLDEMHAAMGEFESALSLTFDLAPRPAAGTTHLAVGLVAGVVATIRKTTLRGRVEELPDLSDELTDWMLSVANEEVVAFCVPRSRSADGTVGGRLPSIDADRASRESVADAGRRALMTTARLVASTGVAGLTSAKIRKDAGLSRREFEQHFTGVEQCFLDAVESVAITASAVAQRSAADAETWGRWLYRSMTALCALAAGDRALARLVLLDINAAGRPGLLRREELIDRVAAHIREQAPVSQRPSELRATASVSAIWRIAEIEVATRRATELPRIAPVFVFMIFAARLPRERAQMV